MWVCVKIPKHGLMGLSHNRGPPGKKINIKIWRFSLDFPFKATPKRCPEHYTRILQVVLFSRYRVWRG